MVDKKEFCYFPIAIVILSFRNNLFLLFLIYLKIFIQFALNNTFKNSNNSSPSRVFLPFTFFTINIL